MLILNPLKNPIFIPVMLRLIFVLTAGIGIVIIFNLNNMQKFFKSEIWKRYYCFLIIAPVYVLSIFLGKYVALAFMIFVIYFAVKEYSRMLHLKPFFRNIIFINGIISVVATLFYTPIAYGLPVLYFIIIVVSSILRNQLDNILNYVTYTLFASLWICYGITHFILIAKNLEKGVALLVMLGFSIAFSDIMAYCIGKLFSKIKFGTHLKIAGQISPNKTYAGILGNLTGAAIGVSLLRFTTTNLTTAQLIGLVFVIGIFSITGDLVESMVKRFAGVKDSGKALPGHGGVLDRIDSLLITAVACYYYFIILSVF